MGTRATKEQHELVRKAVPQVVFDPISRILKVEHPDKKRSGNVVVCTGGTADIPAAEEAAQTAEYFGSRVSRIYRDLRITRISGGTGEIQTVIAARQVLKKYR